MNFKTSERPINETKNKLKIFYCNARSIFNKLDRLKRLIHEISPTVVCVVESWLTKSIPKSGIEIPTYNCIRLDYVSTNPSGGLLIYVQESCKFSIIKSENLPSCDLSEFICIGIQLNFNRKFVLGVLYNHPPVNLQTYEFNCRVIEFLMSMNKSFYLVGDFNLNLMDKKNNLSKKFTSFLNRSNLSQVVEFPTRIATYESKITESLIDLFITNSPNLVNNVSHNLIDQMADHRDLIITLSLKSPKPRISYTQTFREKRDYSREKFQEQLIHSGITFSATTDNIESATNFFNYCFLSTLDQLSPMKTQTFKYNFGINISPELEAAFKRKGKLLQKISKNSNQVDVAELRKLSREIDKLLATEKRKFFHKKFQKYKHDPKKLWSCIGTVVPMNIKKCLIPENEITPELVATFNSHYCIIGSKIYEEVFTICPETPAFLSRNPLNLPQFKIQTTDVQNIVKIVSSMKPSKSVACDGITLNYVKDSLDVLALTITQLINLSIVTNEVPITWKRAILTPVHKEGDPFNPINSRPISILPVPSKAGERVVAGQLANHCEKLNIFNPHQFGYRKSSNTNMALATITETIFQGLDNNEVSLLLLLDLSKAFDSVPHSLLLDVLKYYNLYQPWFESYLSGRSQCTKLGTIISEPQEVLSYGVPQGSILGPILFILYINEVKQFSSKFHHPHVQYKIIVYADDTQILLTSKFEFFNELKEFASTITTEVIDFYLSLKLKINVTKFISIFFSTKSQFNKIPADDRNVVINNTKIPFAESVKTLGVHLDREMKFKTHVNKLCSTVFNKLYYINKCRNTLNFFTRKLLVEYCALSHVNYCRDIWGFLSAGQIMQLQKLLSFGAKIVFLKSKYDHSTHLIESLKFLTPEKTSMYFLCCTAFKCIENLNNVNIPKIFELNMSNSVTRNKIILPRPKKNYMHYTIVYRTSKMWLQLPVEITNAGSFQKFKKTLKLMLLENR